DLPSCPSCGQSVLDDDVDECPFCGASMSGRPSSKSAAKSAPQPGSGTVPKSSKPSASTPARSSSSRPASPPPRSTAGIPPRATTATPARGSNLKPSSSSGSTAPSVEKPKAGQPARPAKMVQGVPETISDDDPYELERLTDQSKAVIATTERTGK